MGVVAALGEKVHIGHRTLPFPVLLNPTPINQPTMQAKSNLGSSSRFVAETVSKKFDNLAGVTAIVEQAVLDRFAG